MIEVDGLMAAVSPTPNASPSADAPAEFAAAMALVGGETGQRETEPGVHQQVVAELVDADVLVGPSSPVDADSQSADALMDVDSLLDPESSDAREASLSSLAVIAPTPASAGSAPDPSAEPPVDARTRPEEATVSPSTRIGEATASIATAAADAPSAAPGADVPLPVARPASDDASSTDTSSTNTDVVGGDPVPDLDSTALPAAAEGPLVADSPPESGIADPTAPKTGAETDVVAPDHAPASENADAEAEVVAVPDAAPSVGAATPPASSSGERLDVPAPGLSIEGLDAPAAPSTSEPEAAGDAVTSTRVPDSTPRPESPTPTIQPAAVATPAPRADAAVADIVDVTPSPSPSASEATPTQQVAEALRDVRRLADGSHRLSLQLHPEELGAVQLEVAIRDGQLHVRAVAETEAARSALEQNLPELRSDLRDAGVRAGSLEVGPDASGRDRSDSSARDARTPTGVGDEPSAEEPPTSTDEPTARSGLDIRL